MDICEYCGQEFTLEIDGSHCDPFDYEERI